MNIFSNKVVLTAFVGFSLLTGCAAGNKDYIIPGFYNPGAADAQHVSYTYLSSLPTWLSGTDSSPGYFRIKGEITANSAIPAMQEKLACGGLAGSNFYDEQGQIIIAVKPDRASFNSEVAIPLYANKFDTKLGNCLPTALEYQPFVLSRSLISADDQDGRLLLTTTYANKTDDKFTQYIVQGLSFASLLVPGSPLVASATQAVTGKAADVLHGAYSSLTSTPQAQPQLPPLPLTYDVLHGGVSNIKIPVFLGQASGNYSSVLGQPNGLSLFFTIDLKVTYSRSLFADGNDPDATRLGAVDSNKVMAILTEIDSRRASGTKSLADLLGAMSNKWSACDDLAKRIKEWRLSTVDRTVALKVLLDYNDRLRSVDDGDRWYQNDDFLRGSGSVELCRNDDFVTQVKTIWGANFFDGVSPIPAWADIPTDAKPRTKKVAVTVVKPLINYLSGGDMAAVPVSPIMTLSVGRNLLTADAAYSANDSTTSLALLNTLGIRSIGCVADLSTPNAIKIGVLGTMPVPNNADQREPIELVVDISKIQPYQIVGVRVSLATRISEVYSAAGTSTYAASSQCTTATNGLIASLFPQ